MTMAKLGKMKWVVSVPLVVWLGIVGCERGGDDTPEEKAVQPAAAAVTTDPADQALIQVLFYGLMAFERDNSTGNLRIWALLPYQAQHKIRLEHGEYLGRSSWKWVNPGWTLDDTIQIAFDPDPGLPLSTPAHAAKIDEFPDSPKEARDSRWMLHAKEIGGEDLTVDRAGASVRMLMVSGEFETCGMVHDEDDNVCRVLVGNAKRAMSEYMVLRFRVPEATDVMVRVGEDEYRVPATGDDAGEGYAAVYDLALTNLTEEDVRVPETPHLDHLRTKLFPGSTPDWKNVSYKNQPCMEDVQTACIARYRGWEGSSSGSDRPLCPFVGGGT